MKWHLPTAGLCAACLLALAGCGGPSSQPVAGPSADARAPADASASPQDGGTGTTFPETSTTYEGVLAEPAQETFEGLYVELATVAEDVGSDVMIVPPDGGKRFFLADGDDCREVDRETFADAAADGRQVILASGDMATIQESMPPQLGGRWLIHDHCETGDPIT